MSKTYLLAAALTSLLLLAACGGGGAAPAPNCTANPTATGCADTVTQICSGDFRSDLCADVPQYRATRAVCDANPFDTRCSRAAGNISADAVNAAYLPERQAACWDDLGRATTCDEVRVGYCLDGDNALEARCGNVFDIFGDSGAQDSGAQIGGGEVIDTRTSGFLQFLTTHGEQRQTYSEDVIDEANGCVRDSFNLVCENNTLFSGYVEVARVERFEFCTETGMPGLCDAGTGFATCEERPFQAGCGTPFKVVRDTTCLESGTDVTEGGHTSCSTRTVIAETCSDDPFAADGCDTAAPEIVSDDDRFEACLVGEAAGESADEMCEDSEDETGMPVAGIITARCVGTTLLTEDRCPQPTTCDMPTVTPFIPACGDDPMAGPERVRICGAEATAWHVGCDEDTYNDDFITARDMARDDACFARGTAADAECANQTNILSRCQAQTTTNTGCNHLTVFLDYCRANYFAEGATSTDSPNTACDQLDASTKASVRLAFCNNSNFGIGDCPAAPLTCENAVTQAFSEACRDNDDAETERVRFCRDETTAWHANCEADTYGDANFIAMRDLGRDEACLARGRNADTRCETYARIETTCRTQTTANFGCNHLTAFITYCEGNYFAQNAPIDALPNTACSLLEAGTRVDVRLAFCSTRPGIGDCPTTITTTPLPTAPTSDDYDAWAGSDAVGTLATAAPSDEAVFANVGDNNQVSLSGVAVATTRTHRVLDLATFDFAPAITGDISGVAILGVNPTSGSAYFAAGLSPDADVGAPIADSQDATTATWGGRIALFYGNNDFDASESGDTARIVTAAGDATDGSAFKLCINFSNQRFVSQGTIGNNGACPDNIDENTVPNNSVALNTFVNLRGGWDVTTGLINSGSVHLSSSDSGTNDFTTTEGAQTTLSGLIGAKGVIGVFRGSSGTEDGATHFAGGFVAAPDYCDITDTTELFTDPLCAGPASATAARNAFCGAIATAWNGRCDDGASTFVSDFDDARDMARNMACLMFGTTTGQGGDAQCADHDAILTQCQGQTSAQYPGCNNLTTFTTACDANPYNAGCVGLTDNAADRITWCSTRTRNDGGAAGNCPAQSEGRTAEYLGDDNVRNANNTADVRTSHVGAIDALGSTRLAGFVRGLSLDSGNLNEGAIMSGGSAADIEASDVLTLADSQVGGDGAHGVGFFVHGAGADTTDVYAGLLANTALADTVNGTGTSATWQGTIAFLRGNAGGAGDLPFTLTVNYDAQDIDAIVNGVAGNDGLGTGETFTINAEYTDLGIIFGTTDLDGSTGTVTGLIGSTDNNDESNNRAIGAFVYNVGQTARYTGGFVARPEIVTGTPVNFATWHTNSPADANGASNTVLGADDAFNVTATGLQTYFIQGKATDIDLGPAPAPHNRGKVLLSDLGDRAADVSNGANRAGGVAFGSVFVPLPADNIQHFTGLLSDSDVGPVLDDAAQAGTWNARLAVYSDAGQLTQNFKFTVTFTAGVWSYDIDDFTVGANGEDTFSLTGATLNNTTGVIGGTVAFGASNNLGGRPLGVLHGIIGQGGALAAFKSDAGAPNTTLFMGGFVGAPAGAVTPGILTNWTEVVGVLEADNFQYASAVTTGASYFIQGTATGLSFVGRDFNSDPLDIEAEDGTTPIAKDSATVLNIDYLTSASALPATNGVALWGGIVNNVAPRTLYYTGLLANANVGAALPADTFTGGSAMANWHGQLALTSGDGEIGTMDADGKIIAGVDFQLNVNLSTNTISNLAAHQTFGTHSLVFTGTWNDDTGVITGAGGVSFDSAGADAQTGTLSGLIGANGALGVFKSDDATNNAFAGGFVAHPDAVALTALGSAQFVNWATDPNPTTARTVAEPSDIGGGTKPILFAKRAYTGTGAYNFIQGGADALNLGPGFTQNTLTDNGLTLAAHGGAATSGFAIARTSNGNLYTGLLFGTDVGAVVGSNVAATWNASLQLLSSSSGDTVHASTFDFTVTYGASDTTFAATVPITVVDKTTFLDSGLDRTLTIAGSVANGGAVAVRNLLTGSVTYVEEQVDFSVPSGAPKTLHGALTGLVGINGLVGVFAGQEAGEADNVFAGGIVARPAGAVVVPMCADAVFTAMGGNCPEADKKTACGTTGTGPYTAGATPMLCNGAGGLIETVCGGTPANAPASMALFDDPYCTAGYVARRLSLCMTTPTLLGGVCGADGMLNTILGDYCARQNPDDITDDSVCPVVFANKTPTPVEPTQTGGGYDAWRDALPASAAGNGSVEFGMAATTDDGANFIRGAGTGDDNDELYLGAGITQVGANAFTLNDDGVNGFAYAGADIGGNKNYVGILSSTTTLGGVRPVTDIQADATMSGMLRGNFISHDRGAITEFQTSAFTLAFNVDGSTVTFISTTAVSLSGANYTFELDGGYNTTTGLITGNDGTGNGTLRAVSNADSNNFTYTGELTGLIGRNGAIGVFRTTGGTSSAGGDLVGGFIADNYTTPVARSTVSQTAGVVDYGDWWAATTEAADRPGAFRRNQFLAGSATGFANPDPDSDIRGNDVTVVRRGSDSGDTAVYNDGFAYYELTTGRTVRYATILRDTDLGAPLTDITRNTEWSGTLNMSRGTSNFGNTDMKLDVNFNPSGVNTANAFVRLGAASDSLWHFRMIGTFTNQGVLSGDILIADFTGQVRTAPIGSQGDSSTDHSEGVVSGLIGLEGAVGVFRSTLNTHNSRANKGYAGGFAVTSALAPVEPPSPENFKHSGWIANALNNAGTGALDPLPRHFGAAVPATQSGDTNHGFIWGLTRNGSTLNIAGDGVDGGVNNATGSAHGILTLGALETDTTPTDHGVGFLRNGTGNTNVGFFAGVLADTDLGAAVVAQGASATWDGQLALIHGAGIKTTDPFKMTVHYTGASALTFDSISAGNNSMLGTPNTGGDFAISRTRDFKINGRYNANGIVFGTVTLTTVDGTATEDLTGLIGSSGGHAGNRAVGVFVRSSDSGTGRFAGGFVAKPEVEAGADVIADFDNWLPAGRVTVATIATTRDTSPTASTSRYLSDANGALTAMQANVSRQLLNLSSLAGPTLDNGTAGQVVFGADRHAPNGERQLYGGLVNNANVGAVLDNTNQGGTWNGRLGIIALDILDATGGVQDAVIAMEVVYNGGSSGSSGTIKLIGEGDVAGAAKNFTVPFTHSIDDISTNPVNQPVSLTLDGTWDANGVISGNSTFNAGVPNELSSLGEDPPAATGTISGLIGQDGAIGVFKDTSGGTGSYVGGFVAHPDAN